MKKIISVVTIFGLVIGKISALSMVEVKAVDIMAESKNSIESEQDSKKSVTDSSEYVNNEIIVVYKNDKKRNQVHTFQEDNEENREQITDCAVIYTLDSAEELEQAIKELEEDKNVDYIQPNYTYSLLDAEVEDPYYSLQWGLHNDGTFQYSSNSGKSMIDIDINAPEAWEIWDAERESQKEVIVAVVDTGIKYDHEDLAEGMWVNTKEISGNGIDDDGNGFIDDYYGWNFYGENARVYNTKSTSEDSHGTHGAGSIVAQRNSLGISGIASNGFVKVMPVKALGGRDGSGSTQDLVRAITYAETMGASICNLSLGTDEEDKLLGETIENSSMLFVAAAGNGDSKNIGYSIDKIPMYPASYDYDNIITVGNIESSGQLSSSSNYGVKSVDLAAPGSYIISTSTAKSGYEYMTGTSMSAPMVSAVAAMIYSYYDNITLLEVKDILLKSVKPIEGLEDKTLTGGILDAYGALTYYKQQEVTPSVEPTKEAEPTASAEPTKEAEPTASAEPTKEAEPTASAEPTKEAEPTASAEPTKEAEPTASAEPTKGAEPTKEAEPTASAEPTKGAEPTKEAEPTASAEPTKGAEPTKEAEPTASAEPTKEAEPTASAEPTKEVKPTASAEPTKGVEPGSTPTVQPTVSPTPVTSKIVVNKPSKLRAKVIMQKNIQKAKVRLLWNRAKGTNGYVIYRSTKKNSGYKRIKIITTSSKRIYYNQNLKKGKTYYYKVRAYKKVNGKRVYSKYSNIKKVKIKK